MTTVVPQIGLTGSIGSGKSTVAELFAGWGSTIVDADIIARELLSPNTQLSASVVGELGSSILGSDGLIDRKALRTLVFSNPHAKKSLESLLHPAIRQCMLDITKQYIEKGCLSVTLVIPLLFETANPYHNLTHTVVVTSDRDKCIARVVKRDTCPEQLAAKIFDSQIPPSEKAKIADYIIENNADKQQLERNARKVFEAIHN